MSRRPTPEEAERNGDYRAERAARATSPAIQQLYGAGARRAYEDAAARTEQPTGVPRPTA